MRVLLVHNRYRSGLPSGENRVVDDEAAMLRARGVEVELFLRSSDEIAAMGPARRATLAFAPIASPALAAFGRALGRFRPDVVHLHNPYPLISPGVVRVARRHGVPVVQTVHNLRHVCLAGTCFRGGRVCEDCRGRLLPWPGVVHGCYRRSRPQSAVMAAAQVVHCRTWRLVDRFLPANRLIAARLAALGIPADRIAVKPNAVADPGPPRPPGQDLLFLGRLETAKGIALLLEAWPARRPPGGPRLLVAGDGPERGRVERAAAAGDAVRYLGLVGPERAATLLGEARALVVPSLLYEGFPRVVAEAFAHGRPVVATALGGLAELVDEQVGWPSPATAAALRARLALAGDPDAAARKGRAARRRYERSFTADRVTDQLLEVYAAVAAGQRSRR
jgi:glycosyltransferase involved in cell wall biosynthesis